MKFKFFLNHIFLSLCFGLTAPVSAMQMPKAQQWLVGICIGCNKTKEILKNLPCEHPVCQKCDELISDDYNNLSITSKCPCCEAIYQHGDGFLGSQEPVYNKALFDPALTPISNKVGLFSIATGGICCLTALITNPPLNVKNTTYIMGSLALIPLINVCFKFKNIHETLQYATCFAQSSPHLSKIIEKRTKAFRAKYGLYSLAIASMPFIFLEPYWGKAMISFKAPILSAGVLIGFGGLYGAILRELDDWGSAYKNIPKIK